jgi:hypothetical protein
MKQTPFELIFETGGFDTKQFAVLREQAETHGAATISELLALPAGGELLRELTADTDAADRSEVVWQVGALLFHAFRYWLHGRVVYRLSEAAVRALLAEERIDWGFRVPAAAGYVQLPRNRFWARPAVEAAAEAVDGFFWSAPQQGEGARGQRLDLLLSLGVRAARPGLTVVPISLEPGSDFAQWADVQARPDGSDFENVLPGGELQGYRALTTHAEALKLAVRAFRHIDCHRAEIAERDGVQHVGNG